MSTADNSIGGAGLAAIWIGGMISIPALILGSTLAAGMPFAEMCLACLIGFTTVAATLALQSAAAAASRNDTVHMARRPFGTRGGPALIGATVGIALMGWFGVQTGIAGDSMVRILKTAFGLDVAPPLAALGLGTFMFVFAVLGFSYFKWLNYVAVPCKLALVAYAMYLAVGDGAWDTILAYRPASEAPIGFATAVGMSIGAFAVGAVIAPDYARHCTTVRAAVFGTLFGILPAAMGMVICGAALSILLRTHDIVDIYARSGMPLLALSVLIMATWTTNVMNAYSAGLALAQFLPPRRNARVQATLLAGLAGSGLAALGVLAHFQTFLQLLTVAIPPIAGVLLADHWFVRPSNAAPVAGFNARGLAAWMFGAAVTVALSHPLASLLGIGSAAAAYTLLAMSEAPVRT